MQPTILANLNGMYELGPRIACLCLMPIVCRLGFRAGQQTTMHNEGIHIYKKGTIQIHDHMTMQTMFSSHSIH